MHELHVVNPPRRRGGRRRRGKGGRFVKGHASNPKHKRRRRHNPARRRRRRNPGLALGSITRGFPLESIGWGIAGAVGTELGGAAAAKLLPVTMQTSTPAKLAVKAGIVLAGGFLARKMVGG